METILETISFICFSFSKHLLRRYTFQRFLSPRATLSETTLKDIDDISVKRLTITLLVPKYHLKFIVRC